LTKITGQPTCVSVTRLHLKIYENAMSISSAHGGSQCSHLGMIMPAAKHNIMANTQPWVDPANPGDLQIVANATTCQITITTNNYNRDTKAYNTWKELTNKLKRQLIAAIDDTWLPR
jgi:hypothetical protein